MLRIDRLLAMVKASEFQRKGHRQGGEGGFLPRLTNPRRMESQAGEWPKSAETTASVSERSTKR
jgi:hypothetical protein